ncbi:MAG: hypothetical protein AAF244_05240, partial [Pseudomonadota bacterium]
MMKRFFIHFALFIAALCLFEPAIAAEKETSEKEAIEALNKDVDEEMKRVIEERRKAAEETFGKINGLMMTLGEREQQHFFLAYNNYNLLETVKVVQKDVSNAIDKCGENNPDMKNDLDTRFKDWNAAVNPMLKESKAAFNNMMIAQDY